MNPHFTIKLSKTFIDAYYMYVKLRRKVYGWYQNLCLPSLLIAVYNGERWSCITFVNLDNKFFPYKLACRLFSYSDLFESVNTTNWLCYTCNACTNRTEFCTHGDNSEAWVYNGFRWSHCHPNHILNFYLRCASHTV